MFVIMSNYYVITGLRVKEINVRFITHCCPKIFTCLFIFTENLAEVLFHLQSFHSRLNQTFFLLFYININKKCFNHCRLYILIIVQIN